MHALLPFIITGITSGAIYGLAGAGLIITYRTSGIFNFAHGAIAATAAYVFYWLTHDHHVDWKIAFVISVLVLGPVVGLLLELVGRRVSRRSPAMQIAATVGLILVVSALATLKYGPDSLQVDQFLPGAGKTFRFGSVNVGWDQLIVTCVAVLGTGAFYVFFRATRVGLAMRAVVDDPDLVGAHGTSAAAIRRTAWALGSVLASASGVFLAPLVGLDVITLTYLVVAAIGAASIGGFASIPLTYVGGILIGVVSDVSQKYVINVTWLSGVPLSLPLLALLIALLVLPKRKLILRPITDRQAVSRTPAPLSFTLVGAALVVGVLLTVPSFAGTHLTSYLQFAPLALMLLSLGLLVRTSGQVSLCHAAFGAIGAVSYSRLMTDIGLPWIVSLLLGALIVVPVAALVALPAIRLSGLFLGLATLAFGIMVQYLVYPLNFVFGLNSTGRLMPRPSWAETDKAFYYLLVGALVVVGTALVAIDRSRLARMLLGMAESPTAIRTMGLSVNSLKVLVFCISGFIAGLAGIFYGMTVSYASYADPNYNSFQSLVLLAIVIIAPLRAPWYALFALPVAIIPGYVGGANVTDWLNLVFGVSAIAVALQGGAPPVPARLAALIARMSRRSPVTLGAEGTAVAKAVRVPKPVAPGLQVANLRVRYGGTVAVDGVSLDAPIGRLTGLIGPNGAGKTTIFNACSGIVRPASGQVRLHGDDVTRMSSQARARKGLGRTFQVTELCDSLTVRQNVAMGREASMAGAHPATQLGLTTTSAQRRELDVATNQAIALCGIEHLADVVAGELSTGERRLVEVARCLAGDFDLLLLDEPSAGLDRAESERLGDVLVSVMNARVCGMLLVEHDMEFVMRLCDYIYVCDFGELLFEGTPDAVANDPAVAAAYLGTTALAVTG